MGTLWLFTLNVNFILQFYILTGNMASITCQNLVAKTVKVQASTLRSAAAPKAVVLRSSNLGGLQMTTRAQPLRAGRFTVSAAASTEVVDQVRGIISEQLGTDMDKVGPDAKFVDLGADSLDTVEIMMALEEKFEITLDEEGAEKIATVQEAADMIAEQVAAK